MSYRIIYFTFSIDSAAQHLPVGHRLRRVALSDVRDVHLHGHGMGHQVLDKTEHARLLLLQARTGRGAAVGPINEVNVFPHAKSDW